MGNDENIELRSEKIRHIIGEIPPKLVKLGTAIIAAVCLLVFACMWIVKIDDERLFLLIFKV